MKNKKSRARKNGESCRHFRCRLGADVLELMEDKNYLPLPHIDILVKTMQSTFKKMGFADYVEDSGSAWIPTLDYWKRNLNGIKQVLIEERKTPFGYSCKEGSVRGLWKFLDEGEYTETIKRKLKELNTRVESYNLLIENGNEHMKYLLPFHKLQELISIEDKNSETKRIEQKITEEKDESYT
jgi:hypothetical protein